MLSLPIYGRAERQPTELSHRYNRGIRLFQKGEIDEAAQEFQRSVKDARIEKGALLPWTLFLEEKTA